MWGDYHAREVALYLLREIEGKPYLTFWSDRKMIIADLAQLPGGLTRRGAGPRISWAAPVRFRRPTSRWAT